MATTRYAMDTLPRLTFMPVVFGEVRLLLKQLNLFNCNDSRWNLLPGINIMLLEI